VQVSVVSSTITGDRRPRGRTEPRSGAGTYRTRLNRLRHGLAATLPLDPGLPGDAARLASALANGSDPLLRAYAVEVADAELALLHVRRAKLAAIASGDAAAGPPGDGSVAAFAAALPELGKLERYDRRAFSRRRRAAQLLMAAHALAPGWKRHANLPTGGA
jgi:hypothetical protein